MKKREYVWCICHIDNKLYGSIEAELKKAKYAGTEQPNPRTIGINALPESPSFPIIPSITYATLAIYPLSSRNASARKSMNILGRKVSIPPTPAMIPSTIRETITSLVPIPSRNPRLP